MSRVLASCDSNDMPVGTRMMMGRDRSYLRVVRRSVIPPILQFTPRIFRLTRVPFFELNLQRSNPACRPGWLSNQSPVHSFANLLRDFIRGKVTLFPGNALAFSFYLDKVICPQALVAFREHANRLKHLRGKQC